MKQNKLRIKVIICVTMIFAQMFAYGQQRVLDEDAKSLIRESVKNEEVTSVLFDIQKIYYCSIISSGNEELALPADMYWERGEKVRDLNSDEIDGLLSLIVYNRVNYVEDFAFISNPYIPEIEFTLISKSGKSVNIRISPSDKTWSILYNNKCVYHNRYIVNKEIEQFINSLMDKSIAIQTN